ncbi:MAG: bifunctional diaminohydroxyphosphoribosylaminopyrimidine deaminase/5-amino-6-(5-phosphoribosylamino)uracil reductase RibD [Planctomycetaceae bacterium]|nr:bifunctional diaminohydroxyphosphoribosylaminopyrimidine deaminase/5-amino-6-(5-phosphoribosylamino)uracil reductase RibD [Planctomycetaceae bacterium]
MSHLFDEQDLHYMRRALSLAATARGCVEPNPLVGCVIVRNQQVICEGFHRYYGGPHAEADALAGRSIDDVRGSTIYVTLEPCSHFGKTPPCAELLAKYQPARVVIAMEDPFAQVSGRGVQYLESQNIQVHVGVCETEARYLNRAYLQLQTHKRPWVHGKWAMTADGKIATRTGESFWISGDESRRLVHQRRAQVDAILVGSGTALHDNPMLNPREGGPRIPLRIVFDSQARTRIESNLVRTAHQYPTLLWVGPNASRQQVELLRDHGCEVVVSHLPTTATRLEALLFELGRRRCTNVWCEGGSGLLGALLDLELLDEIDVFIAPKLFGGQDALTPIGGLGIKHADAAITLHHWNVNRSGNDIHLNGTVQYPS